VNSPTAYGLCLPRIVVKNNSSDVEIVRRYQDAIGISTVPRNTGPVAPAFNLSMFNDIMYQPSVNLSLGEVVLRLTAALAPYNQPEVIQDRSWVAQQLAYAGISHGNFVQPHGTSIKNAEMSANASMQALLTSAGSIESLGNNWTQPAPQISGNFRSFYSARYFIALVAYLQLSAEQALYPSYSPGGGTLSNMVIGARQAYLFTFSQKPELLPSGFWSLTIYGATQFLISNTINQYALGDRSNLTCPEGTLLRDGCKDSGKFQILIQPADVPPPSNWTSK
jgi:hypothetical protein